jgi:hypothetical protein
MKIGGRAGIDQEIKGISEAGNCTGKAKIGGKEEKQQGRRNRGRKANWRRKHRRKRRKERKKSTKEVH